MNKQIKQLSLIASILSVLLLNGKSAFASSYVTSPYNLGNTFTYIIEDATVFTNSQTGSTCGTSSYSKNDGITTMSVTIPATVNNQACNISYVEFNTLFIPDDAIITSANFTFSVNTATNARNCNITSLNDNGNEPFLSTASTIWTDAHNGTKYFTNNANCATTGDKSVLLPSQGLTDIQNSLASRNWFALAITSVSESRDATQHTDTLKTIDNAGTKPQLIVSFTKGQRFTMIIGDGTYGSTGDISESGRITTNTAISGSCPTTTFTKNAGSGNIIRASLGISSNNAGCDRGYYQFNTTSISDGSTIYEIALLSDLRGSTNIRACDINPITNKPSVNTASTIWTDIGDGSSYVSSNSDICGIAHNEYMKKGVFLGGSASSDLQSLLSSNWFAVGFKFHNETRDGSSRVADLDSATGAVQDPRIVIQMKIAIAQNENININDGKTKSISKSYDQALSITDNKFKAIFKSFNEDISVIFDKVNLIILKAYNEGLSIVDDFASEFESGVPNGIFLAFLAIPFLLVIFPIILIRRRRR